MSVKLENSKIMEATNALMEKALFFKAGNLFSILGIILFFVLQSWERCGITLDKSPCVLTIISILA